MNFVSEEGEYFLSLIHIYMPELKEKRNIVLYNLADKILDAPAQKTDRYLDVYKRQYLNYFEIRTHSYIESVRFLKFLISIYVVSCMNKISP